MMRKKTYIWISAVLCMLRFFAAYQSDHHRAESVQAKYSSTGSADGLINNSLLVAQK